VIKCNQGSRWDIQIIRPEVMGLWKTCYISTEVVMVLYVKSSTIRSLYYFVHIVNVCEIARSNLFLGFNYQVTTGLSSWTLDTKLSSRSTPARTSGVIRHGLGRYRDRKADKPM
jgi:hypothetical protein